MRIPFRGIYRKLLYFACDFVGSYDLYFKTIGLKVGKNCRIYTDYFGSEPYLITIGDHVAIASGVRFITHDGSTWMISDNKGRRYLFQPIEICDNVFIGMGSTILPGVKIEKNVLVAAGSVVTKSIPEGSVVAGVPAKIIGSWDDWQSRALSDYVTEEEWKKTPGSEDQKIAKLTTRKFKPYLTT